MNKDWTTTREARLLDKRNYLAPLQNVTFSEAKKYFSDAIENVKHDLALLKKQNTIWPVQCEDVIFNLDHMKTLVQRLCEVLNYNKPHSGKLSTDNSRRELVIKLYYVQEQLDKLQKLVRAFRPLCRATSKQAEKKRTAIFRNLELFMLHCDDIIQSLASLQEKPHEVTSVHSVLALARQEMPEQQIYQPHEFTRKACDCIYQGKSHSHLLLVKDGFVEERDAPQRWLIVEDQPTLLGAEQQEYESIPVKDTQPLVSNTSDCPRAVTGNCMSPSKLENEQQSENDLRDEGPCCS